MRNLEKDITSKECEEDYKKIEQMIEDTESPVGIDAKKTHVIIVHKLMQIEERLKRLEEKQ